ncbi:High-affinity branched-chain amino acid transport system permease protein LivM [Geodia barretti]|uniref:High-affinity branched-chain amino acid transport system permease protein LivM n=1 Tax=Geodia barretti TaxID=519541 RepID=A0AA35XNC8_GEOBA|nr:High-affinity branched-chain amino acid transport system permease protein LivM [Geodia barretti]
MDYIYFLAGFGILAGIYAVFTLGLNIHWGYTGLFNIGIAGFFALGAYTSALLTTAPPSPELFEDFIFGGNLANALKLGIDLVGAITLRLRGDYLAISTLGIAESVRLMFLNEKWLANGSRGLYNIPKFLGDWVSPDQYDLLYFIVVIVVLAALYFAVQRAIDSPWGRVLRAIREDEEATAAAGKNVFRFNGNNLGAILGAFVVWGIWSGTQFLPESINNPNLRFFLIGFLLVFVILLRPNGILGERRRVSQG